MQQFISFLKDYRNLGLQCAIIGVLQNYARGLHSCHLPGGISIKVRGRESDYSTVRQIFIGKEYSLENGEYENCLLAEYRSILAKGRVPVIVDAGANIGAAALWFKKKFPRATIVCIEPDKRTLPVLRMNVVGCGEVIVENAAIGCNRGFAGVIDQGQAWATQTKRAETGVPIITLDDAVSRVNSGVLFIAKIDIEGFESDLFSSNVDWVDAASAVFIEPHDWMMPGKNTSINFQRVFSERGFEFLIRGENLVYLHPRLSAVLDQARSSARLT